MWNSIYWPSPELIEKMGNKSEAKQTMKEAGIPVVPGTDFPVSGGEEALEEANKIGFPVMIKASAGGAAKGCGLLIHSRSFRLFSMQRSRKRSTRSGTVLCIWNGMYRRQDMWKYRS